ncbi:hypothetical protein FTUN_6424 [Frigoriglobus tundricola]|uniref:Uncharacterized protein n=1 Tax=Frigoriglobus tundricola TaxID=2774151 RepID=A0A6M5YXU1_9BACT|nr:hypothetical protein FTUN_6424 [Frigoriglobus tundricola]
MRRDGAGRAHPLGRARPAPFVRGVGARAGPVGGLGARRVE